MILKLICKNLVKKIFKNHQVDVSMYKTSSILAPLWYWESTVDGLDIRRNKDDSSKNIGEQQSDIGV